MIRRQLLGLFLSVLLATSLAGCDGTKRQAGISGPVAVSSPQVRGTVAATPHSSPAAAPPATLSTSAQPAPAFATSAPVPASVTPSPSAPPAGPTGPTAEPASSPTALTGQTADLEAVRVALERVVGGLEKPVGMAHAGDGSGRLFVLEQVGRIRIVQNGVLVPHPFLDIADRVGSSGNEQGLLGLVFHPDYARNGLFFVNYTDRRGDTVIARFSVSAEPARADPASERVLLNIDQPAANHNGGHLAFGPDGYLYVGTGDGGGAGDQFGNGQNGQALLGKMLRLDVDQGDPYAIPGDNPFLDNPEVRHEIWAIGLRNPWRYSFDRLTGDLYIADVGQNRYEEVNVQPAGSPGGENYGWPIMEGAHCFPENRPCDRAGLIAPAVEYDHGQGCSVTGGAVYRGQDFPSLYGIYLFGDYCSGQIWGMIPQPGGAWQVTELARADVRISSFGEDEAGELYLLDMAQGELFKITAQPR